MFLTSGFNESGFGGVTPGCLCYLSVKGESLTRLVLFHHINVTTDEKHSNRNQSGVSDTRGGFKVVEGPGPRPEGKLMFCVYYSAHETLVLF